MDYLNLWHQLADVPISDDDEKLPKESHMSYLRSHNYLIAINRILPSPCCIYKQV